MMAAWDVGFVVSGILVGCPANVFIPNLGKAYPASFIFLRALPSGHRLRSLPGRGSGRDQMSDDKKKYRSAEWFGAGSKDGFNHRAWMKNQGRPHDQFDGRPVIGICNSWSMRDG